MSMQVLNLSLKILHFFFTVGYVIVFFFSVFVFSDKGMKYMVGKEWRDFFDVVIVQADKPHFFNDCLK